MGSEETTDGSKTPQRACRACENCRKRKVKCSGGEVCKECQRFQIDCVYREHYRSRRGFSIKILQSPDFESPPPPQRQRQSKTVSSEEKSPSNDNKRRKKPRRESTPVADLPCSSNNPTFLEKIFYLIKGVHHDQTQLEADEPKFSKINEIIQKITNYKQLVYPHQKEFQNNDSLPESSHLTEEQMLQYLADYFNTYYLLLPFFDPETWIKKAKSAWRCRDNKVFLSEPLDLAIVYMLIALGSCGGFSATFSGYDDKMWSKTYGERARRLVPNPFNLPPSIRLVQYIALQATFKIAEYKFDEAYMHCGLMVRNAVFLGLNLIDPAQNYEAHRTWYSVYVFERYWCFCVGKPTAIGAEYNPPQPYPPAFRNNSVYSMGTDHISARLQFCDMTIKSMSLPFVPSHNDHSNESTIQQSFKLVTELDKQLQEILTSLDDSHLSSDQVRPEFSDIQCREWYWLRLFYLYIRLVIYRPFLFVSHYFDIPFKDIQLLPHDTLSILLNGTQNCLEAAMAIPPVVAGINSRLERCQLNWFSNTYLESASAVLLLYSVSLATNNHPIPPNVLEALIKSINHINGNIPNGESRELQSSIIDLVRDAEFLNVLGKTKREEIVKHLFSVRRDDTSTDGFFKIISSKQPSHRDLETFWRNTLHLIGFQGM